VKLKINTVTSTKTLLPVDYYKLPFCQPDSGPKLDPPNLGEFLSGDRLQSSPYVLKMKNDIYCQQVCVSNLGIDESSRDIPNPVVGAIRNDYHNNWLVDNLPAAYKMEDDSTVSLRYVQGFPIGFIKHDDGKAYVYNHVNLEIMYHPVEDQVNKFRVVRFTLEPFSIKHDYSLLADDIAPKDNDDQAHQMKTLFKIENPIPSCNPTIHMKDRHHTTYEMVNDSSDPQPASGQVLFTYDVIWIQVVDIYWASRWDVYLTMDDAIPTKVHWLSICNSLIIVLVLSGMIVGILMRNLRQDLARYNKLATDEETTDGLEEKGWKLVHADVFRPPSTAPLFFCVCCGTGAQLMCMAFWTILLAALGFLNGSMRGLLIMTVFFFYILIGGVGGCVTARLYKTFDGTSQQRATVFTALGFPGLSFLLFFIFDLLAWGYGSSYAVPFATMLVLLICWLGIALPLTFLGAHFGYKQDAIELPVKTSNIPRPVPHQPWFRSVPFTLMIGGILPFGLCYIELIFILESVWQHYYFTTFGFLLFIFCILLIACAETTLLIVYFQLRNEDYRWWWRCFGTAGSMAAYVIIFSFVYFQRWKEGGFWAYVFYFGYMALSTMGLFLMLGFVGVASSLWFNITIFGSIKVD